KGVSVTRSSPKSFCRPSVIRKTPPSRPMSSPMRITLASSSIALRSPLLRPLASVSVSAAISVAPLDGRVRVIGETLEIGRELGALPAQLRVRVDVDVVEHRERFGVGQGQAAFADVGGELVGLAI